VRARAILVGLLAAGALGATGCGARPGPRPGEARLTVSGRAQVARPAGPWRDAGHGGRVHAGDRVRVLAGSASLRLPGAAQLELRRGSRIEMGPTPRLLGGDALVRTSSEPLSVGVTGGVASTDGIARLRNTMAVEAAVYRGAVQLSSAGRTVAVPALRQVTVPAPGLVPGPVSGTPFAYDPADTWDRRYLGDAIALGRDLTDRSRGLTAQLGSGEGQTPGFYRLLLPDLDAQPAFADLLQRLAASPAGVVPGETLVGAAVAVEGRRGTFADRWAGAFEFRQAGADWGLVALDQRLSRDPIVGSLDQALARFVQRAPVVAAAGPEQRPAAAPGGRAAASARAPAASPDAARPPQPAPAPTTGPVPPSPPAEPVSSLVDTVKGLLDKTKQALGARCGHPTDAAARCPAKPSTADHI